MSFQEIDSIRLGVLFREPVEVAVIDLRPQKAFGNGTPLHGANIPLVELSENIVQRVPHKHTRVVLVDGDGTLVGRAAELLIGLGYTNVFALKGGTDYNERLPVVPIRITAPRVISGEVERRFEVPVTTAKELAALRDSGTPYIVFDTRSLDEYERGHIPGSWPAPGGEIVPIFHALVDNSKTHVVLTCAGRSRAVLAAQTLIAGNVRNPVSTLDYGTLGWVDEGFELAHGLEHALPVPTPEDIAYARDFLSPVARQFSFFTSVDLQAWQRDDSRTTYALDVRLPEAFARNHLPGSVNAPAGQFGIWIGKWVAVQRARLALIDDEDSIRALTVARWFARVGWDIAIVKHDFGK